MTVGRLLDYGDGVTYADLDYLTAALRTPRATLRRWAREDHWPVRKIRGCPYYLTASAEASRKKHPRRARLIHDPDVTCWVYFISYGDSVKIGSSANPALRLRNLNLPPPGGAILRAIPGGQAEERLLHHHFAALRVGKSEWFRWEGELPAFVEDIPTTVDIADDWFQLPHLAFVYGRSTRREGA